MSLIYKRFCVRMGLEIMQVWRIVCKHVYIDNGPWKPSDCCNNFLSKIIETMRHAYACKIALMFCVICNISCVWHFNNHWFTVDCLTRLSDTCQCLYLNLEHCVSLCGVISYWRSEIGEIYTRLYFRVNYFNCIFFCILKVALN